MHEGHEGMKDLPLIGGQLVTVLQRLHLRMDPVAEQPDLEAVDRGPSLLLRLRPGQQGGPCDLVQLAQDIRRGFGPFHDGRGNEDVRPKGYQSPVRIDREYEQARYASDGVVVPAANDVTVTDNTVVVTVNSLPAQASFVVTIDCTLIGPAVPGEVLVNEATVAYDDPLGNPKPPQSAPDPPEIAVHGRYFMPIVFRK